jgi:hypothetical protein
MSVISTLIEPHRVTRVFFGCLDTAPNPADRPRAEQPLPKPIPSCATDPLQFPWAVTLDGMCRNPFRPRPDSSITATGLLSLRCMLPFQIIVDEDP